MKQISFSVLIFLSAASAGLGQVLAPQENGIGEAVAQVQRVPEFPGGEPGLAKYLSTNMKYTDEAKEKLGRTQPIVSFMVGKDSLVKDIKITSSEELYGMGIELMRVFGAMPKWSPATDEQGSPIDVVMRLPIDLMPPMKREMKTIPMKVQNPYYDPSKPATATVGPSNGELPAKKTAKKN